MRRKDPQFAASPSLSPSPDGRKVTRMHMAMDDDAADFFNEKDKKRNMSDDELSPARRPRSGTMKNAIDEQYQEDVHDMLDDISMPNQSMSISNLSHISQSPFRGAGLGQTPTRGIGSINMQPQSIQLSTYEQQPSAAAGSLLSHLQQQNLAEQYVFQQVAQQHQASKTSRQGAAERTTDQSTISMQISASQRSASKYGAHPSAIGREDDDFGGTHKQINMGQLSLSNETGGFSQIDVQPRGNVQVNDDDGGKEEQKESDKSGQKNRTFADSVLLQGMIAEKKYGNNPLRAKAKNEHSSTLNQRQSQQEPTSPVSNPPNCADISAMSNITALTDNMGGRKLFRMALPKTPERSALLQSQTTQPQGSMSQRDELIEVQDIDKPARLSDLSGMPQHLDPITRAQQPTFLTRSKDADKQEISQLKLEIADKDLVITKMQRELAQAYSRGHVDQASLVEQIDQLCKQLETEKLLTSGLRNQMSAMEKKLREEMATQSSTATNQQEELTKKVQDLEQYISQIIKEYGEKEQELQSTLKKLAEAQANVEQSQRKEHVLNEQLTGLQERCSILERDLEAAKDISKDQKNLQGFDAELRKIKEQNQREVQQLRDENKRLRLTEERLRQETSEEKKQELIFLRSQMEEVKETLARSTAFKSDEENGSALDQLFQIVELAEESQILRSEYEKVRTQLQSTEEASETLEQELLKVKRELEVQKRKEQSGPSAFTKSLLAEKDQEIILLRSDQKESKRKLTESEDKLWHAEKECEVNKVQIAESEKLIKEYEARLEVLLKEKETLRESQAAELSKLKSEKLSWQQEREALTQQVSSKNENGLDQYLALQELYDNVNRDKQMLQMDLMEARRRTPLIAQIVSCEQIVEIRETRELSAQCDLLEHDVVVQQFKDQIEDMKLQLIDVQNGNEARENDISEKLKAKESELRLLNLQIKRESQQKDNEKTEHSKLKDETQILQSQIEKLSATIKDMQRASDIQAIEFDAMQQEVERMREAEQRLLEQLQSSNTGGDKVNGEAQTDADDDQEELLLNYREQIAGQNELIEQLEFELSELRIKQEQTEKHNAVLRADLEEAGERESALLNESTARRNDSTQISNLEEKLKRAQGDLDRETRQHSEELERVVKAWEERLKRAQCDHKLNLEGAELDHKEALSQLSQKHKKELKSVQEKMKAEQMNKVDDVKNDMARAQAEWDRERKKLVNEAEIRVQDARSGAEESVEERLRTAKDKADKLLKRKLLEQDQEWQQKYDQVKEQLEQSTASLRQLKIELNDAKDQLSSVPPEPIKQAQVAPRPLMVYLNRYGVNSFERVLSLEFKKILLSIKAKTEAWSEEKLKQQKAALEKDIQRWLEARKDDVDSVLKKVGLQPQSDEAESYRPVVREVLERQGVQLKGSMDNIKQKISEVLIIVKESLKQKTQKQVLELEQKLARASSQRSDDGLVQWASMAIGALLIVQIGCVTNQSIRESTQSQLEDPRSFKELLTFLFRVIVCLRKRSQGSQELKSEVYRLKLLNQEIREDSELWSRIVDGQKIEPQEVMTIVEQVLREETQAGLNVRMRDNLTRLMTDYGKLADRLADVLNGKDYNTVVPAERQHDFDNDQTIRQDFDDGHRAEKAASVRDTEHEDAQLTKRVLEPGLIDNAKSANKLVKVRSSYEAEATNKKQPEVKDDESVNLETMTQGQAVDLLTKVFQKLNLTTSGGPPSAVNMTMQQQWPMAVGMQQELNQTATTANILGSLHPSYQHGGNQHPYDKRGVYASQQYGSSMPGHTEGRAPRAETALMAAASQNQSMTIGLQDDFKRGVMRSQEGYQIPASTRAGRPKGNVMMLMEDEGDDPSVASEPQNLVGNLNEQSTISIQQFHPQPNSEEYTIGQGGEDCIRQAETLLKIFGQKAVQGANDNGTNPSTARSMSGLRRSANMPLQLASGGQPYASMQKGDRGQWQMQPPSAYKRHNSRGPPQNVHASLESQQLDLNNSASAANFRSLDQMSNVSGPMHATGARALSGQRPGTSVNQSNRFNLHQAAQSAQGLKQGDHEESLEKLRERIVAKQKTNSMLLNQNNSRSPNRLDDQQSDLAKSKEDLPAFKTAQDYYKYHKKLRSDARQEASRERAVESNVNLDRYDAVLSPIGTGSRALKHSAQQHGSRIDEDNMDGAQMELRPPQLTRANSGNFSSGGGMARSNSRKDFKQFQTVEASSSSAMQLRGQSSTIDQQSQRTQQRPNLPRHDKKMRASREQHFATIQQNRPAGHIQMNTIDNQYNARRGTDARSYREYGDEDDQCLDDTAEYGPGTGIDDRSSQRETIPVYASSEVSERPKAFGSVTKSSGYAQARQQAKPPRQADDIQQDSLMGHSMRGYIKQKQLRQSSRASGRYATQGERADSVSKYATQRHDGSSDEGGATTPKSQSDYKYHRPVRPDRN